MREMKDSGVDWIGIIPNNWDVHRNKVCFDCSKEIVGTNSSYTQLLSLTTKGIKEKRPEDSTGKVPESYDTYQVVKKEDLVMCLFDLDVSAVFAGLSPFEGMISPAYKVLKCKEQLVLSKFADYWFSFVFEGRKFKHYSKNLRYTLNYDEFGVLPIVLPSTQEQKVIASFLDRKCAEINQTIADTEKTIEEYKILKQSIITEAVTHGIRGDRQMKDSGIEWIGQIPDDWLLIKGKYLFKERNQRGNSKELQLLSPTQKYGVIPQKLYEELSGMKAVKLEETVDLASLKSIYTGDFCISLRSFQGGFEYSRYNGVVSPAYHVFFAKTSVYTDYFMYLFKEFGFINKMASLTKTFRDGKSISFDDFSNSLIPYPPIETQKEISSYLNSKCEEIEGLIDSKLHFLKEIENYKKSLIYEYVTGKKEVV